MADRKITALTELTSVADGDYLPIVDVSDTTQAVTGSTKKITKANLITSLAASSDIAWPYKVVASSNAATDIKAVADYLCDGTADNVQIQAAIDSLSDTYGGTIFLTEGIYDIQSPILINIPKGIHLTGAGFYTLLKAKNALNDYVIKFVTTSEGIHGKMSNFKIDANAANQSGGGGIYAPGAVEFIFDSIIVSNPYDWGIWLYEIDDDPLNYGHNNKIINCSFEHGDEGSGIGGGIYLRNCDENHIIGCNFHYMGGSGITAGTTDGYCIKDETGLNTISQCAFVNSKNGVKILDVQNSLVANCQFDNIRYFGIHLKGPNNNINNNIMTGIGTNGSAGDGIGLMIEYYGNNSIIGNRFQSSPTNNLTKCFIQESGDGTQGGSNLMLGNFFAVEGTLQTGIFDLAGTTVDKNLIVNNHGDKGYFAEVTTKTASYTATLLDKVILVDATSGAVTITLPSAGVALSNITIKKTDNSANAVTVSRAGSDTIDGATSKSLADQYDSITIQSDGGTSWNIIGSVGL